VSSGNYKRAPDWSLLVQNTYQELDADGVFDYDPEVGELEVNRFFPDWLEDQFNQLTWTLEGGVLPPVLVTFGLAIILQNALLGTYSADSRGLDAGQVESASIRILDQLAIGVFPLITLIVAVGILVGLHVMLGRTQLGRVLRATADDGEAARLMGIDHRHIHALAMAIALGTVAVAGIFLGIRTTFGPFDGPSRLIYAFEAVVIGGLGSLWGTLVGGLVLGVAQAVGGKIDPALQIMAGHLVFLAVLAFRPQGLFTRPTLRAA
jgi:branched-chain amino acid transport system permease protein